MLPNPIKKFVALFSSLPSIGPRQATRLAFFVSNLGKAAITEFIDALVALRDLKACANCFFTHQNSSPLCDICLDPKRRADLVAIVEKETDLISLERAKKFDGKYLVLGDLKKGAVLEPAQKLKLQHLKAMLTKTPAGVAEEIIIATNPTTYGDLSATVIARELAGAAKKITRLGRGIPTGGEIEFADEDTLGQALNNRG